MPKYKKVTRICNSIWYVVEGDQTPKYKKHKWTAKITLSDGSEISWFAPTKHELIDELNQSFEKDHWTNEDKTEILNSIKQEY